MSQFSSDTQINATTCSVADLFCGMDFKGFLSDETQVTGLCLDSRQISSGDLFFCLSEDEEKQVRSIEQALEKGAEAVVFDPSINESLGDRFLEKALLIEGLAQKMSAIAGNYYGHPSKGLSIAGVTGTNGKTTVCSWVEQLFALNGLSAGSIGTLGVQVDGVQIVEPDGMTTRDPIRAQEVVALSAAAGAQRLAMEVSSHGMAQYRTEAICFAVAVFTNFSRDHLDFHGNECDYWNAKKRLFELPGIGCAVLNIDDEKGRELAHELSGKMQLIKFSAEGDEQADIYLSNITFNKGFCAQINSRLDNALQKEGIFLPQMSAEFELSNLLAAVSTAAALGLPFKKCIAQLDKLKPAKGRLELVGELNNSKVYVDYAHTPDAVARVLSALSKSKPQQLIAVLGCGGDRDIGKRPEMAKAVLQNADRLIITSDNPRSEDPHKIAADMLAGVQDLSQVTSILDRQEAIEVALKGAPEGACVAILGKGHERLQIVGERVIDFDDAQVAKEVIARLGGEVACSSGGAA